VRTELARRLVGEKVGSQSRAARHYQRQGCAEAGSVLARLRSLEEQCAAATSLHVLRGVEGAASAAWFELLGKLLRPPWRFTQRQRRPPPDPVNALLSLGYTWLLTRTVARVEAAGLEAALGALHEYRASRPSLACDLMEPLRVPAVDRWVVALCNGSQVAPDNFLAENGGVRLQPAVFGRILTSWQTHWIESHQDRSLDAMVQEIVALLRATTARLPTPPELPPEARGSGVSVTGDE
jgi:CRISPR-associated protein Cas1